MAKPRSPDLDHAEVTGALAKNPKRFAHTGGIHSPALGAPPAHFDKAHKVAWECIKNEMPWLTEADRCITEMCTVLRLKVQNGAHITTFAQYRSVLKEMGATPTSRKGVKTAPPADGDENGKKLFSN